MIRNKYYRLHRLMAAVAILALFAMPLSILAQTRIVMPKNKYKVSDDVELGRKASQEVAQQMPLLRDSTVEEYVESVGRRLVAAIPEEFQHREFNYEFDVVNARDINAFALPGGPMYVNRGMIEAARSEGEMAGVMAHEISHVALRHATAQATETQKFQIGSVLGQIAGAVIGGVPGAIIGTGSQIGFGAGALKYSRKYETQADILGAQIMARAGYDPRDLGRMFQTIQAQGGGSSGGWFSSHPSPSDRFQKINQEAAMLRVNPNAGNNSRAFHQIQARLRGMGQASSMEEIARSGQRYPSGENTGNYPTNAPLGRVSRPSTRYQSYSEFGGALRVNVPNNWREIPDTNSVWFAPEGAYGQQQNQVVYTHGVNFGVVQPQSRNLQQGTQEFLNGLAQSNNMRQRTGMQRSTLSGRTALTSSFTNVNEATGQTEVVTVITTQLRGGQLLYMIAVAPQNETRSFQTAFTNILRSVQLRD